MTDGKTPMNADDVMRTVAGTWPPVSATVLDDWLIREGGDGGKRVSAASYLGAGCPDDDQIAAAKTAMRKLHQPPLFQILPGQTALDSRLAALSYDIVDPVDLYAAPIEQVAQSAPPSPTAQRIWPSLAIMREIWEAGGIGPGRLSVMDRAPGPKTAIFERVGMKPAGACFVSVHEDVAMIHALEVLPTQRGNGAARHMMGTATAWAQEVGATQLSVVVTGENTPAKALYTSLGMQVVGHYHYRAGASGKEE